MRSMPPLLPSRTQNQTGLNNNQSKHQFYIGLLHFFLWWDRRIKQKQQQENSWVDVNTEKSLTSYCRGLNKLTQGNQFIANYNICLITGLSSQKQQQKKKHSYDSGKHLSPPFTKLSFIPGEYLFQCGLIQKLQPL